MNASGDSSTPASKNGNVTVCYKRVFRTIVADLEHNLFPSSAIRHKPMAKPKHPPGPPMTLDNMRGMLGGIEPDSLSECPVVTR
jgi:hypothetical protein